MNKFVRNQNETMKYLIFILLFIFFIPRLNAANSIEVSPHLNRASTFTNPINPIGTKEIKKKELFEKSKQPLGIILRFIYKLILTVLAVILPPLAVFLALGLRRQVWRNILFTLLLWVPGIIHAWWCIWVKM